MAVVITINCALEGEMEDTNVAERRTVEIGYSDIRAALAKETLLPVLAELRGGSFVQLRGRDNLELISNTGALILRAPAPKSDKLVVRVGPRDMKVLPSIEHDTDAIRRACRIMGVGFDAPRTFKTRISSLEFVRAVCVDRKRVRGVPVPQDTVLQRMAQGTEWSVIATEKGSEICGVKVPLSESAFGVYVVVHPACEESAEQASPSV